MGEFFDSSSEDSSSDDECATASVSRDKIQFKRAFPSLKAAAPAHAVQTAGGGGGGGVHQAPHTPAAAAACAAAGRNSRKLAPY